MNRIVPAILAAFVCLAATPSATPRPVRTAKPMPSATPFALPSGFVYLSDVAPDVVEDMHYYTDHNFVGRRIDGYDSPVCILTRPAAQALAELEKELVNAGLTLRVYDCYRPQRAVNDFIAWGKQLGDQRQKAEYYPDVDKSQLFALGYIATHSAHSRGSAVDLTIQRYPVIAPKPYQPGTHSCKAAWTQRYHDGSIDMGTSFDCMDALSHYDAEIGHLAYQHRRMLHDLMEKYGFVPYRNEWWHFTLSSEPYPTTYFDFPVRDTRPAAATSGSHGRLRRT